MIKILETNRLFLRELNIQDSENFYNLNLNPNVIKYTGNSVFKNIEESKQFLLNYQDYKLNVKCKIEILASILATDTKPQTLTVIL